jgi:hypothetical protein
VHRRACGSFDKGALQFEPAIGDAGVEPALSEVESLARSSGVVADGRGPDERVTGHDQAAVRPPDGRAAVLRMQQDRCKDHRYCDFLWITRVERCCCLQNGPASVRS